MDIADFGTELKTQVVFHQKETGVKSTGKDKKVQGTFREQWSILLSLTALLRMTHVTIITCD